MAFKGNTFFETFDLLLQLRINMGNPQYTFAENAAVWKTWADGTNKGNPVPVAEIQASIRRNIVLYKANMQWVKKLQGEPERYNRVLAMMTQLGGSELDITDIITPHDIEVAKMEAAPIDTKQQIITLCNRIIAEMIPPVRLEPRNVQSLKQIR